MCTRAEGSVAVETAPDIRWRRQTPVYNFAGKTEERGLPQLRLAHNQPAGCGSGSRRAARRRLDGRTGERYA